MSGFGDILDAWESSSGKPENPGKGKQNSKSDKNTSSVTESGMQREWLEMFPPGEEESRSRHEGSSRSSITRKDVDNLPIQGRLDLHGFTLDQALDETNIFLRESIKRGFRKVLIIHGKGYHSEGGTPVLKKRIRIFLENSSMVSRFGFADRRNGGAGASWILLKGKCRGRNK